MDSINELSATESLSRRDREKRTREQEILKAARELFVSKGFRETTLEEIAHHAEFGKGTLYNYFASKEELFFGITEQVIEETLAIARESVAGPGSAREKTMENCSTSSITNSTAAMLRRTSPSYARSSAAPTVHGKYSRVP
jgi:AcrR family transcriptional regulator